ncbi:MAG: thiamine biosynthesis protein ThiF [Elusimicrobia bacterium GWA2_69_24]|nr:MAG: thiamine biosynthesis protein ThiF [Elusimicrobia bacterium GWA2_69_24]HBL15219.1 hypothetical protein [Elusimicrobiota bacterium]
MSGIFERNPPGVTEALSQAVVGVAGCGGLGSNAAIALARAGVGTLILADFDQVELSNLNRQQFVQADIGTEKVRALGAHLKAIHPELRVEEHACRITPENAAALFGKADLLIEAFDRVEAKQALIGAWCRAYPGKPLVCGNGVSGFGGSAALKVVRAGGNLWFCGDGETDNTLGLCSARVAIVANMQADLAIALLVKGAP